MKKIGKTIILTNGDEPYKGECSAEVFNKASNVISIVTDKETGCDNIKLLKIASQYDFYELNKAFLLRIDKPEAYVKIEDECYIEDCFDNEDNPINGRFTEIYLKIDEVKNGGKFKSNNRQQSASFDLDKQVKI